MPKSTPSEEPIRVEEHLGLLRACVLRFTRDGSVEDSDLYSVGCVALMEAARTFDPSKSRFCTWATRIITQRILDEIKRDSRVRESYSSDLSDHPQSVKECLPVHILPDLLGDDCEDRRMLVGRYLEGRSLSDLGREFGFSKEGVRKRISSAASRIRRDKSSLLENYA